MIALDQHPSGRHFLQIPGPSPVPGSHPARAQPAHHRPPRARVRAPRQEGAERHAARVPDPPPGRHLSGVRHRRMGGRARQHDERRRCGADVRDRPFRVAVAQDGAAPRARARVPQRARHRPGDRPAVELAPRRPGRSDRGAPARRRRPCDQGGLRRPQRDIDRRDLRHRRGASRDRCGRPSGAADGRHDLRSRQRRLPA